ncbi:hypothetical protein NMG60_11023082 [Bertholletia excelsa]
MSVSPKGGLQSPSKRRLSWSDLWVKDQALRHVIFKMGVHSISETPPSETEETPTLNLDSDCATRDLTSALSDEVLLRILSKLPESQHISSSIVCKRWLRLCGRLVSSIKLSDWDFLESGRLIYRFPNLTDINIVRACVRSSLNSGILVTHRFLSVQLDSYLQGGWFLRKQDILDSSLIDRGVGILAEGCPNLRRLVLIGASAKGLSCVAEECLILQELELHYCPDLTLKAISGCQNLQILKLIGRVDGFYDSVISDIGLTIVAQGCKRLLKLELAGCEGSYDGIKAIGQCCQMLEELTLFDHRMDGSCPTLEELHVQRCQMRDKQGVRALFIVCEAVRELILEDCWGLEDSVFSASSICRRIRFLSLEGCSILTAEGLDAVVPSWKELQRLKVVSCNNIKDSEITPSLASLFSVLKELKWRPDSRSLLSSGLAGTGLEMKGGRSFRM